jgi:hypothetical protein
MEDLWIDLLYVVIVLAAGLQLYRVAARRSVPASLLEAAEKLSFEQDHKTFTGECHGTRITMRDSGKDYATIEVRGPEPSVDRGLRLAAGASSELTGDAVFDREVRIRGLHELELLALADPDTRKKLVEAVRAGTWLEGSGWCARFTGFGLTTEALVRAARAMGAAHAALELALRRDLREALHVRLRDPDAGVRRRVLAEMMERGWAKAEVLEPLLKDLDPEVRLGAAVASREGEVLLQMVAKGSRTWRIKAAQALLQHAFPLDERGVAIVEDAGLDLLGDEELSEEAAELLGTVGRPSVLAELAKQGSASARKAQDAIRARHREHVGGLAIAQEEGGLSLAAREGALSKALEP